MFSIYRFHINKPDFMRFFKPRSFFLFNFDCSKPQKSLIKTPIMPLSNSPCSVVHPIISGKKVLKLHWRLVTQSCVPPFAFQNRTYPLVSLGSTRISRALAKGLQRVPSAQRCLITLAGLICPENGLRGCLNIDFFSSSRDYSGGHLNKLLLV